jgi:hypothetical protein
MNMIMISLALTFILLLSLFDNINGFRQKHNRHNRVIFSSLSSIKETGSNRILSETEIERGIIIIIIFIIIPIIIIIY